MYHLVNPGGAIADNPPVRCWTIGYNDPAFGCGTGDPQDSQIAHNPLLNLDVEQYYLKDVLPREMDVHTNDPALAALQAQAIAARSVATWKSIYQPDQHDPTSSDTHAINNSTEFQVYIPGAIDTYQNPRDPAGIKQNILDAVSLTTGQYLSYSGEPIDAEFASDAVNNTLDDPAAFPKSYLKRVEEPISSNDNVLPVDCQAHNLGQLPAPNLNLLNGMSQKGAIRWSLGNQCAAGGDDSTKWSVAWDGDNGYKQILAHYYTGIDILNGSGSPVAPNDRWNLLSHSLEKTVPLDAGLGKAFTIKLQNTSSAAGWIDPSQVEIGYKWTQGNTEITPWAVAPGTTIPPLDVNGNPMALGSTAEFALNFYAPSANGEYTLHLDLRRKVDPNDPSKPGPWFSSAGWTDATISSITVVNGTTVTPTFTPTPTLTPQPANYALRFKPSVITYPSAPSLDFGGDMTIEFWLRTTTSSGGGAWYTSSDWILNKDITFEGQHDWAVVVNQGRIAFNNGNPGGWDQPLYSANINDGSWHHIAIVRNVSTGDGHTVIYVDGAQNASGIFSTASLSNTLPLSIGSFSGDMDDLRLWNIPRSQSDIQNDMYVLANGDEAGLVGYWPFNEGSGLVANDITQNHVSGQLRAEGDPEWILVSELYNGTIPTPQPTSTGPTPTPLDYTPQTPTETPSPTGTPPTPTPTETCWCPIDFLQGIFCSSGTSSSKLAAPIKMLQATQSVILDIQLFHRVEDEILSQTTEGQHYSDLYYGHGTEIIQILKNDSALKDEAITTLQLWEPNLQALVDGQGSTVTITSAQVQSIQTFLDHLYTAGSTELRQTIESERTLNPLEQTIGTTMNQASVSLVGYQVPPANTPTPISTSSPTFTSLPTATPTPTETPTSTSTPASTVYTLVLQPNGTNGVDNYILKSAASTNYGASSDLGIGEKNSGTDSVGRSLIKFDLSSVPADATIVSATLSLWTSQDLSNTDTTVNVYRLKVPFNESQSNWNRSATGVNWQAAGASGANDRESSSIGSVQILANESLNIEKQISMDPAKVQEMLNGTFTNNGFVLAASGELDDRFVFKSSDSSTTTQRPKLVIQYTSQSITPTATITSTSTNTPTATNTSTSTPSNTPTATPTGFIFADGFEGGSLSAWSSTSADSGDLSASTQAAGIGSYGMAALLDDAAELRVTDTSPTAEKHYSTRFYLDPNSINLPNGQDVYIFSGSQSAVGWTLCLNLKRFGEDYRLTPCIETDARIWESGKGVYITDAWQSIEMEWQAASAAGANDGYLKLWVNDVLADEIDHIDNDTQAIDFVSIGALSNIPSSLSGTMYFDGFVSYTGAHIGLDVNGPAVSAPLTDLIFKDDFESNDFSLWSSSTTGGGDLSLSTGAAMHATYGMQALVNDITTLYVTDYSPDHETEYRARFQFDPNSITIPSGNGFTILSTGTASGSGYRIMLSSESGVYKLQAQAQNNAESWIEGAAVDTLDAAQLIEVEYKAASAAGANDGYLKLWINDSLVDTISNLDNDTYLIDTTSLGVVGSLDAGTSGTVYFDAFESYKTVRSASSTSTQIETPTPTITAPETPTIFPTETAIPTQIGAIPHPAGGALFAFLPAQLGTITPVPPTGSLTITYTYDALNRLTSAVYSDGRHFNYTYDANGNTLQLERDLGPGTVTTSYIYDAANQLNTAVEGSNTWQFTYDANGSLTSNGVSSYTYDSANRLIAVDGADIDTTMSYNGLGQRLSMEAAGVTTQYVMAGNNPLTADADGNVTTYLYGLGAVAEKTTAWNYALPDGSNTPRQLTNASGAVTFATRYSPWGDTLETYGAGNFAFGYYGGVMDAATGLLYVGNGQYYDPATGRFLTRDAKSKQDNPYTPFDPMGALFAPLGLVALVYSNRKKGSKWVILLVILSFAVVTGMTLSGCGLGDDATPTETPTQPPSETPSPNGPGNDSGDTTSNPGTPTSMPETPCLPETSTSTPSNTYRLTGIDWEGTGLVQFLGNLMSESSKQAVLLALDMIQRASGKTPDGVSHWISNNGIRVYGVEGDGRIGGNSVDGSVQLNSANTTAYLSPDGLGVIIHELAHGIDVTVGKQKGYSESYSMHFYPDGSGWNVDWFKNNVGNIEFRGDLRGPANDYLRFNGVLSPTEDFATAFASVVIETNIQLGLMNFAGTTDLSPYIRLVPGGEAPAWPSFGYVNDERRALIKGILE